MRNSYPDTWTRDAILKRLEATMRVWLAALAAGNDDAYHMIEKMEQRIAASEAMRVEYEEIQR